MIFVGLGCGGSPGPGTADVRGASAWEPMATLGVLDGRETAGSAGATRPPPTQWARGRLWVHPPGEPGRSYDPERDTWATFPPPDVADPRMIPTEEPFADRGPEHVAGMPEDGPLAAILETAPGALPRSPQVLLWTGELAVVLDADFDAPLRGYSYAHAAQSWSEVPGDGPRRAGVDRRFAWTGRLLVYLPRGQTPEARPRIGGAYDPATNAWIHTFEVPPEIADGELGALRVWRLEDDRLLVRVDRGAGLGVLDARTGLWARLPSPPLDTEEPSVHYTGRRLIVFGGVERTMVDPGQRCGPARREPGVETSCDDIDPTYRARWSGRGLTMRIR